MDLTLFILVSLSLTMIVYITRALPFFFERHLKTSPVATALAVALPLPIMTLLLAHNFTSSETVPALIGIAVTAIAHLVAKQTLVSIALGTTAYILILSYA